uniref:Phosphate ABC transporter substrate-binding protein, PhoT family n=1 Tax=Chlorobium chlorochromatii (strain CaD3) TaxID=340177 RepID=Q3ATA1_CHLCH
MRITQFWKHATMALAFVGLASGSLEAREQIRIVGSSTVFPFASYVAEEFGKTTGNQTPVIESTGSGGGHKLFGESDAITTPDITNSSRRMKKAEFDRAKQNGIQAIHEVVIGYDGIVIANAKKATTLQLTRRDLFFALAEEVPMKGQLVKNPYTKWSQIRKGLPNQKILVYGPPTSSGTRDAFDEMVMEASSKSITEYGALAGKYKKIRQDGVFVPSGENDNLIVQRIVKDKAAVGVFGYSFLEENADRIKGATIDGVAPVPANITSGKYPVSRDLYFYVKGSHIAQVKGLKEYVDLFVGEKMIGDYGYLKKIGLIPLPKKEREAIRANWNARKMLTGTSLD